MESVTALKNSLTKKLNDNFDDEEEEQSEMMNFINQDDLDHKYLKRDLSDPSSALILVQGHSLLHLCMAIATYWIEDGQETLQCYQYNTLNAHAYATYETSGAVLSQSKQVMLVAHAGCFLLLQWQYFFNFLDIHSF
jgi:hypothetical protein